MEPDPTPKSTRRAARRVDNIYNIPRIEFKCKCKCNATRGEAYEIAIGNASMTKLIILICFRTRVIRHNYTASKRLINIYATVFSVDGYTNDSIIKCNGFLLCKTRREHVNLSDH